MTIMIRRVKIDNKVLEGDRDEKDKIRYNHK